MRTGEFRGFPSSFHSVASKRDAKTKKAKGEKKEQDKIDI